MSSIIPRRFTALMTLARPHRYTVNGLVCRTKLLSGEALQLISLGADLRGAAIIFILAAVIPLPHSVASAQGTFKSVPLAASPDRCRAHRYCVSRGPATIPLAGFAQVLVVGPVAARLQPGSRAAREPGTGSTAPAKFVEVNLNKGKGFDAGFAGWAAAGSSGKPTDIFIDELNEAGQRIATRQFVKCRAAAYQGMPSLDSGSAEATVIHLKLRCAG
jgi:hypothetical protein